MGRLRSDGFCVVVIVDLNCFLPALIKIVCVGSTVSKFSSFTINLMFTCFRYNRYTEMATYMEGSPNLSVTVSNSQVVRRVMMQPPPAPVPVAHREPYPPYASGNNNYSGISRPQRVSSGKTFNHVYF